MTISKLSRQEIKDRIKSFYKIEVDGDGFITVNGQCLSDDLRKPVMLVFGDKSLKTEQAVKDDSNAVFLTKKEWRGLWFEEQEKAKEEEEKKNLERLYFRLDPHGSGQYILSARVESSMWQKIASHMQSKSWCETIEADGEEEFKEHKYWVIKTGHEDTVAKILCGKGGQELIAIGEEKKSVAKATEQKHNATIREIKVIQKEMKELFLSGEYVRGDNEDPKLSLEGEKIMISEEGIIYGLGSWAVIEEEYVWIVENNGHDGDNWSLNNIRTGGAGAIGRRVEKTEEIVSKLHQLQELKKSLKI